VYWNFQLLSASKASYILWNVHKVIVKVTKGVMTIKVLVILPCCKNKTGEELYFESEIRFEDFLRPEFVHRLDEARKRFRSYIDLNSTPMSALGKYNGFLYRCTQDFKQQIKNSVENGEVDVLIMSAVYGFLHPSQYIFTYEKEMDNKTANLWINLGLPEILEEYIRQVKINKVFGFFARSSGYFKVVCAVNWNKMKDCSILEEVKIYYPIFGAAGAQRVVPQILGKLVLTLKQFGFDSNVFQGKPFHFNGYLIDYL